MNDKSVHEFEKMWSLNAFWSQFGLQIDFWSIITEKRRRKKLLPD